MSGLNVLFEDARVLAVEKPSGVLVIPGRGDTAPTLQQLASEKLGRKALVVHRLDREASGLVLFAKTAAAHSALNTAFERRETSKLYLALVAGALSGEGKIDAPLREFGSGRTGIAPDGKPSVTLYKALGPRPGGTLVEVRLITGRRHQIRAHLASIGHPLLGDPLYGPPPRPVGGAPRLMLHAWKLSIPGLVPEVTCPPPPELT